MEKYPVLKSPIAVTMGCPVGIGPEILLKFFQEHESSTVPVIVIGDIGALQHAQKAVGTDCVIVPWTPGESIQPGTVPVFAVSALPEIELNWGRPTLQTAQAMVAYIEQAVELIDKQKVAAMVTCPISKIALKQTGSSYPGHTEMLAALTKTKKFRMMMAGPQLKVVLVTIHEPLSRVSSMVTEDEILDCIEMTAQALQQDFALSSPRIAVAGLNPHSGENGMFGHEEEECITPALQRYSGPCTLSGPWPPDTVFHKAAAGDFDAVIAMYHDQGLIPFKLLHFKDGVNVTLGLPIVRTSVDHGTAYDIAGQGLADCASLSAAVQMASTIVTNRERGNAP